MPEHKKGFHPVSYLLAGALVISFSGVLVKICHVPSTVSAFYRVFFGSIFLFGSCLIKGELGNRGFKKNILAILCGLLFAIDLWSWHLSIQYIGPGLATLLGNCQVFVLALVGILVFKEKLTLLFAIAVPVAFLGLYLIIGVDIDQLTPEIVKGILLGVLTALSYSMFLLLLRKLQSDKNDFSLFYYLMVVSVSCSVFLGAAAIASGQSFRIPDTTTWLALIGLGILVQAVAWVIISNALPKVDASLAGLILLLQPALSFVWDVLFFNRLTGWAGWCGVVLVLAGINLGMIKKDRPKIS